MSNGLYCIIIVLCLSTSSTLCFVHILSLSVEKESQIRTVELVELVIRYGQFGRPPQDSSPALTVGGMLEALFPQAGCRRIYFFIIIIIIIVAFSLVCMCVSDCVVVVVALDNGTDTVPMIPAIVPLKLATRAF
jgi:hypothetical protein